MKHPWNMCPRKIIVRGNTKLECVKNVIKKEKLGYECLSKIEKRWYEEFSGEFTGKGKNRRPTYYTHDTYTCVMAKVN